MYCLVGKRENIHYPTQLVPITEAVLREKAPHLSVSLVNYCTRTHLLVCLSDCLASFPARCLCVFSTPWS